MRLILCLMMICATALLSGCGPDPVPVYQGPLFCDRYEPREFTQAEVDARILTGPTNFKKDLVNNEDWRAECPHKQKEAQHGSR
ncbi:MULTISPECIES: hypothetical protein [Halocynthiibacter]|uniref:Lipoprotein n=1 Tax=Halocynthiibacter halioticoli TaxID=2986804 RepID=A0AAE3J3K7_9RHOB|nr:MULTISPECIES: hypothetical protein [Halocynthiibacter]MCV6825991.1 hypothetical protein [Halocynthiibacter halioticoli]MCW4058992.1 hypothetical protein [Halocynthiibacter sp. SDUM655004]